ncbi:MAG: Maf family protein [candidate division KSB1 bacterium]|nr:Maf family protein [candidate division KSB1 bacterium]MDZ7301241.1 Maf family protein [candidate division KSB1 bacterium]MDZ7310535.1 Maf family protein [candidate division KSB1 bacterium]
MNQKIPELILVSTSSYRRKLLEQLGLPFRAVAPKFEENHLDFSDPRDLVKALSRGKAMSVAGEFPNAILIGSDQAVWFDGKILGKPGNAVRALEQLQRLRGKLHKFYMGLFLYHTGIKQSQEFLVSGSASLRRDLTDEELRAYIELDKPFDCAGAAKIEGRGLMLYETLICDDWSAIIGLPLMTLTTGLRKWGYPIFLQSKPHKEMTVWSAPTPPSIQK